MFRSCVVAAFAVYVATVAPGCSSDTGPHRSLTIVGTTTHIENIVRAMAGEEVEVAVLVPGGMCPGHFDIAPQHVRALEGGDALIMHGWEKWAADVIDAAGNGELQVFQLTTTGNAMVPDVQAAMAAEIAGILCTLVDSSRCSTYTRAAAAYVRRVADSAEVLHSVAEPLRGTTVVCAEHQGALLRWLGCTVVADYGRPEGMTPAELGRIEDTARAADVRIVVDNVQSGATAGRSLAGDIGAHHVALSNFPLDGSYLHTLNANVHSLLDCVADDGE